MVVASDVRSDFTRIRSSQRRVAEAKAARVTTMETVNFMVGEIGYLDSKRSVARKRRMLAWLGRERFCDRIYVIASIIIYRSKLSGAFVMSC